MEVVFTRVSGSAPVRSTAPLPAAETPDVKSLLVVIPAYNEEGRVGTVVERSLEVMPHADVVVVDDGSRDRTADEARAAGALVLSLPVNLGYGAALQTGFKFAVRKRYDLVAQIDADGQHYPEDLEKLVDKLLASDADVVIGSRFLDKDGHYKPSAARKVGMSLFARVASAATSEHITDSTSGFQVMRASVARFFCGEVYPTDYPDADILILLHRSGFKVTEVPVRMRVSNGTSMHSGHRSLYYMYKMMLSVMLTLLRRRPKGQG